ncbi:hypothetical protein ACJZ2D_003456 [Fusarium nematophilum]
MIAEPSTPGSGRWIGTSVPGATSSSGWRLLPWRIDSPCSPAWLSNMDHDWRSFGDSASRQNGNPFLGQGTKHVLWCDSPGCTTGSGLGWLRMVKALEYETCDAAAGWRIIYPTEQAFEGANLASLEYEAFDKCRHKYRRGG